VFVRDAEKARSLFTDRVDIFTGDLADSASLTAALQGSHSLFLVNSGPRIPVLDAIAAQSAKAAAVQHIVKLSSLDVEQSLAIGAWHEQGEAAIRASGIPYTFIRPTGFMSNLLAWAHSVTSEGVVRSSTGDGRRAFIHSDDIAAVTTRALTTREYLGQSLPITGPEALSFPEITARISTAIGKPLVYQPISDEEAGLRFSATGASSEEVAAHVSLWRAIREGRLATVTNEVQRVLGREPVNLDEWLMENAAAFGDRVSAAIPAG
ncbi:MAG TPA: NmrA family NAD(P)-binding protein, partial [Silvibacterium sp.]|nr:NmrA family NAD(P)-binding protein [Silvibacterium sp.]